MTIERTHGKPDGALRVGQFTGWHGDRTDGMAELLESGVEILTGDYLAELTMLVLAKNEQRGGKGYVSAFVDVLALHLDEIAEGGIKVVTNAGGLDAPGLAAVIRELCAERGVSLSVAAVIGDDVRDVLKERDDLELVNIDTGVALDLSEHRVLTANAYLGAWPVVEALRRGADIVVCPRTTDASLVVGAAAWKFGWKPTDYDQLAGAVVAGHIIECGAQATGGNFSFFAEHGDLGLPGMPLVDISQDGSAIIGKSVDSGGLVTTDTVLAQLFYEVNGHAYQNPDVVTDLTSVHVESTGADRVRVSGTVGFAPTSTAKLSLTFEGGYRNTMTIGLTGANLKNKIDWIRRQVEAEIGKPESFDECRWATIGPANVHGTFEEATAWLVLTVRDKERNRVDRAHFSSRIVSIATSSVPGFYMTTPPQSERLFGVQWPSLIEKSLVHASVLVDDGSHIPVAWPAWDDAAAEPYPIAENERPDVTGSDSDLGATTPAMLGAFVGTRSGDKAGSANLGAWARDDATFRWLDTFLTVDRLRLLMPELADLRVERFVFSNLRGMNFMIYQYLGDGVSACTRIDPQGKGLGEYLASRLVEVPVTLYSAEDGNQPIE
ncbi:acyclic terpene utilization AtuA family protein [Rhodococcus sp. NPDC127530]|uniref:acyclic terpene utilization AtuA family protein n=1 Tax=unclassified Rhodococcus (in: high G+C Gram-positive bacteria) TaxID=192944 RepID=UPI0036260A05